MVPSLVLPEVAENANLFQSGEIYMISKPLTRGNVDTCVFHTLSVFDRWFFNMWVANPEVVYSSLAEHGSFLFHLEGIP